MEQIAKQAGVQWTQVPFKGEAEVAAALLGNHVEVAASGTGLFPLVQAGKVRMLVVWTEQRAVQFPDVPTLMDSGQNLVSASPYGLAGPKGMDPKVVQVLHDAFHKALMDPAHLKVLNDISQPVMYKNSADYTAYAMRLIEEEQAMIRKLGLGQK
jgi:tripartite-type tricarboxylate transporter receptor subunit TctC